MYELDFHLSNISELNATSAQLYHDLGKELPDEYKPEAIECIACMTTEVDMKALNDADIREIVIRWRRFSFLRKLYMDENLFEEYEEFRSNLSSPELPLITMKPRKARGGIKTTHMKQYHLFVPDFKSRFHKCVVLHSITVGLLHFASRAIDLSDTIFPTDYNLDAHGLVCVVKALWRKHDIEFDGDYKDQIPALPLVAKIDCLEVFDFLYMFLLPKILPFKGLASWTEDNMGEAPYNDVYKWYDFLDSSRWVLQPLDLVELIQNRAWTGSYPADKTMYMQTRGMFERRRSTHDYRVLCTRYFMVKDLRNSPGFVLKRAEDECWWDRIRAGSGSSFLAESLSIYREVLEKLKKAEGREFGEDQTEVSDARLAALPMFRE